MTRPEVTFAAGQPVNRLILAINHYISTGDRIGEGIAFEEGAGYRVIIPVNPALPADVADFEAFRARLAQIAATLRPALTPMGVHNGLDMYSILVAAARVDALAEALRERPGPRGWGSPKVLIDQQARGGSDGEAS